MPKVVRQDIDNLNIVLTVSVAKEEYQPKVESELKKYQKKATIKGFRPGNAPMSFVKNLVGTSMCVEIVNELMNKALVDYIEEEKLSILGRPIMSEHQKTYNFNVNVFEDMDFMFDLGLAPIFEINKNIPNLTYFQATIEDDAIAKDLKYAQNQLGERSSADDIQDNDIIKLGAVELEGDAIKPNGVNTEFSVSLTDMTDKAKKLIEKMKKGDVFRYNITSLEKETSMTEVKKHILGVSEDTNINETFEFTVNDITRLTPAELNQDFFDKYFGPGNVTTAEEAKEKIKQRLLSYQNNQSDALFMRDFQEGLLEANQIPLPDEFLKRWLKSNNEKISDDILNSEYDDFAKTIRLDLLRNAVFQENNAQVTRQDIEHSYLKGISQYLGQLPPELIQDLVKRAMADEKSFNKAQEDAIMDKFLELGKTTFPYNTKNLSVDELNTKFQDALALMEAIRQNKQIEATEEV